VITYHTEHRVDVHHHFCPPAYIDAVNPKIALQPVLKNWTLAQSIEDMDQAGVWTAMLSITSPGVFFGDAAAASALARTCNEYGADLVRNHPGRFGLFAALPMPDVDASLREIAYALDVLKADGIGLYTSYDRRWLGDPSFTPVFDELDRRKAVVFTHPTANECCTNLIPDITDATIEFGTETTRTIASLLFSGAAARHPNVNFIFAHAGGTMPFLFGRFVTLARDPRFATRLPQGPLHEVRRFSYDIAQSANPGALASLLQVIPISQILFGTDFPFSKGAPTVEGLRNFGISADAMHAIGRTNPVALLPRLGAA
jgi:predicted TIM-barrel fold metal-dependent hydrolase